MDVCLKKWTDNEFRVLHEPLIVNEVNSRLQHGHLLIMSGVVLSLMFTFDCGIKTEQTIQ